MKTWHIVWRDRVTGQIIDTAGASYRSWEEADAALTTLLGWHKDYTPTIESRDAEELS